MENLEKFYYGALAFLGVAALFYIGSAIYYGSSCLHEISDDLKDIKKNLENKVKT